MVILGMLLIIFGAIAILSAVFVSEGSGELLGIDMGVLAIFLVGVAAGAAILWGYSILKWGTSRSLAHRRERKELLREERRRETERDGARPRTEDDDRPTA